MDMRAVGERIRAAREAKRMTQQELAELVDLSPTHVSVIERGVKSPRLETFILIANALEVSADALLIDVVNDASQGVASELSELISSLPAKERIRILKIVRVLAEN